MLMLLLFFVSPDQYVGVIVNIFYMPINKLLLPLVFISTDQCDCYCLYLLINLLMLLLMFTHINRSIRWCCCQLPCLVGTSSLLLCCVLSLHCPHDHTLSCLCNYNCHEDIHYYILYNTVGIIYMDLRLSRPLNCARIVLQAFTCKSMCSICCYPNLLYLPPMSLLL